MHPGSRGRSGSGRPPGLPADAQDTHLRLIAGSGPALRARVDCGDTVLTGVLADQAALYGVLTEAEALGLELIVARLLLPEEPRERPS
ncbi:MAG: hypothetical protein ACRDN0_39840 [Trebonia sp.]